MWAAFLRPPCSTWPRVVGREPRPLTDPWKTGSFSMAILHDNRCAQVALRLANGLQTREILWALEHLETSLLWRAPEYRAFMHLLHVFVVHLHQCQFGICVPTSFERHPGTCRSSPLVVTSKKVSFRSVDIARALVGIMRASNALAHCHVFNPRDCFRPQK